MLFLFKIDRMMYLLDGMGEFVKSGHEINSLYALQVVVQWMKQC